MTEYRPGDRVRSLGVYKQDDDPYHVPAGMLGTVVGLGAAYTHVQFDGRDDVEFVYQGEIEPATRKERIIHQVRQTGRPFVARVTSPEWPDEGPDWAFILADGNAYPFEDHPAGAVMDVARKDPDGWVAYDTWDLA